MKINANLTPSLLNKFGKPVSKITLAMNLGLDDLDDVNPENKGDGMCIVWDEDTEKYVLSYVTGTLPPGDPGDTLYYAFNTAEEWLATNNLYNDGTNIGIGTIYPEELLHVDGNIKISNDLIFSASYDPVIVPENESYIYLVSEAFYNYGYNKSVTLKTMLETGEEVIISSTLT